MERLVTREELMLQEQKFQREIEKLRKENAELHNAIIEAKRQQGSDHVKVPIEPYCVGCQDISLKTQVVQDEDICGNEKVTLIHKCKRADFCKRIAEQIKKAPE